MAKSSPAFSSSTTRRTWPRAHATWLGVSPARSRWHSRSYTGRFRMRVSGSVWKAAGEEYQKHEGSTEMQRLGVYPRRPSLQALNEARGVGMKYPPKKQHEMRGIHLVHIRSFTEVAHTNVTVLRRARCEGWWKASEIEIRHNDTKVIPKSRQSRLLSKFSGADGFPHPPSRAQGPPWGSQKIGPSGGDSKNNFRRFADTQTWPLAQKPPGRSDHAASRVGSTPGTGTIQIQIHTRKAKHPN